MARSVTVFCHSSPRTNEDRVTEVITISSPRDEYSVAPASPVGPTPLGADASLGFLCPRTQVCTELLDKEVSLQMQKRAASPQHVQNSTLGSGIALNARIRHVLR